MKNQLENRLRELIAEHSRGVSMITELDTQRNTLRESLFRIGGAIQVLEEELAKEGQLKEGPPIQADPKLAPCPANEMAPV